MSSYSLLQSLKECLCSIFTSAVCSSGGLAPQVFKICLKMLCRARQDFTREELEISFFSALLSDRMIYPHIS